MKWLGFGLGLTLFLAGVYSWFRWEEWRDDQQWVSASGFEPAVANNVAYRLLEGKGGHA